MLTPGGILRLSVPNFAVICKLYQSGIALDKFLGTLYGRIPDGKNGFVYHRTTYDERSLSELLGKLGFNEIRLVGLAANGACRRGRLLAGLFSAHG